MSICFINWMSEIILIDCITVIMNSSFYDIQFFSVLFKTLLIFILKKDKISVFNSILYNIAEQIF